MTDQPAFGRRQSPPRRLLPTTKAPDPSLSAAAEAFAKSLQAQGGASATEGASELAAWKAAQARQTLVYTALGLLLFAPGLITIALHLPLGVSAGMEAAAFLGNLWLRQARRARRSQILAWTPLAER